jgi:hypothetical protein
MALPVVPENLENIPVTRDYLAELVAALISDRGSITSDIDSVIANFDNFVRKDGTTQLTGDLSMGGFRITNLGDPLSQTDAATKEYVDSAIGSGGGGGGSGGGGGGPSRDKRFVSYQSGDLTVPSGSTPGVISGTTFNLTLDTPGKVSFTVSGVFIGAGTTPSAQFGLRINGTDYIFAKIVETNISGTFATSDTPMSGVVALDMVAGIHTIDWIGCSTNGSPKIKASGGIYATMDVDFPAMSGGGGGAANGTILVVLNQPTGNLSPGGSPTTLPNSNFSFVLTQTQTVAIDICLYSEAGTQSPDAGVSCSFFIKNTNTLVSTPAWIDSLSGNASGNPAWTGTITFPGIKRVLMSLNAGTHSFQITAQVGGSGSFVLNYPLSVIVTLVG